MSETKIIGISMVRNEDLNIERAITNVASFCDKIILLDNQSTDRTWTKIMQLCETFDHLEAHKLLSFSRSHQFISHYAGSDSWLFGVDGDEIYDPTRLVKFRTDLISGKYNRDWLILGNVLHCVDVDWNINKAKGYLTPPSKCMTKLYNFRAIESWPGDFERFHNDNMIFHKDYDSTKRRKIYLEHSWSESPFRCLHLCFMRRSSFDTTSPLPKPLPGEAPLPLRIADRLGLGHLVGRVIQKRQSSYKQERYARGHLEDIDISSFR